MNEKNKFHTDEDAYIHNAQDDLSDALYLSITSHNLPYNRATMDRITPVTYDSGKIVARYFLDHGTPDQILLAQAEFLTAFDDEVSVDRLHVTYFKGSGKVPFVATV